MKQQSFEERGRFWRGYGNGLLITEAIREWMKPGNNGKHQQAFIRAYIFYNWQSIEAKRQSGGWPEILRDFQESLPENANINEETFRKVLRRAGFSDVGREGRPPKEGQKSAPMS